MDLGAQFTHVYVDQIANQHETAMDDLHEAHMDMVMMHPKRYRKIERAGRKTAKSLEKASSAAVAEVRTPNSSRHPMDTVQAHKATIEQHKDDWAESIFKIIGR